MKNITDHLEEYFGKIGVAWKDADGTPWQFYVLRFLGGPIANTTTYSTLGLSDVRRHVAFSGFNGSPVAAAGELFRSATKRMRRTVHSDWLPITEVQELLADNHEALLAYVGESPLWAVNADHDFLVVVRDHDAWFIEGQGWHDANRPVAEDGVGRQMINYYDRRSWSKLPVPSSLRVDSVVWDGKEFLFSTSWGEIRCSPRQAWLAVQDSLTGRGLSEEEIEHNFRKHNGSAPLKWHSKDAG